MSEGPKSAPGKSTRKEESQAPPPGEGASQGIDPSMLRTTGSWPAPGKRAQPLYLRSSDVLKATLIVLAVWFGLQLLWSIYALVIAAFLGGLFGLAISSAVEPIANYGLRLGKVRLRIPRGVAAGIVVFGFIGVFAGTIAWSAPTLSHEFGVLRQRLPQAIEQVDAWLDAHRNGVLGPIIAGLEQAAPVPPADTTVPIAARDSLAAIPPPRTGQAAADSLAQRPGIVGPLLYRIAGTGQRYLFPFISSAFTVLAGLLLVIMLAIFVAADPKMYHKGLMHLVPHQRRARVGEVLSSIAGVLRKWLRVQLIGMATIGVTTTIALYILGVPAALPLGILAGILEFIPNLGPLLSAVPAVLMGFIDGPEKALWIAITYMLIQQLESNLLIPVLMQEGVDLPPVLTILAQSLMTIVFGFLGLLIAVPLLAIVMVAVKMLYVEDVVGDVVTAEEELE